MKKEHFDDLISNSETIKIGEWGGQFLLIEEANTIIAFFFKYRGFDRRFSPPENRIKLTSFQKDNFQFNDIPLKIIKDSFNIMVNADIYEFAMTFLLSRLELIRALI